MSYSKFGEFMRILRIKNYEIMGDTARLLKVSVPFLSAVENGKKNVPSDWIPILVKHYNLSKEEEKDLMNSIDESKMQLKLNMQNSTLFQRRMALQFARSFDDIDEDTAKKIMKLLEGEANGLRDTSNKQKKT